jgi:hypothetical protein
MMARPPGVKSGARSPLLRLLVRGSRKFEEIVNELLTERNFAK